MTWHRMFPSRLRAAATGILLLLLMGLILSMTGANAEEAQCAQLRSMNRQYRGVNLSIEERSAKAQLTAWYRANCGRPAKKTKTKIVKP